MTYLELIQEADRKLDKNEITIGEYEEMIKPLKNELPKEEEMKEVETLTVKVKTEGLEETTEQIEDLRQALESPLFVIRKVENFTVNIHRAEE